MRRGVQFQFIYFLQKQYKSFRYRHSIYYKNVISRLRDINCFKQYYLYILSSAVCLLSAELVLPVVLNKTCMEPKEEGTLVIFTWNILNNQNPKIMWLNHFIKPVKQQNFLVEGGIHNMLGKWSGKKAPTKSSNQQQLIENINQVEGYIRPSYRIG